MELATLTISELRKRLSNGDISSKDIVKDVVASMESKDAQIGGYLSKDVETALSLAETADLTLPLGGIPIAIKDAINVKGEPCSCASQFLQDKYTSPYDATVITKLREAGAIPLGRTNMDEFAMGSSTENSSIQKTRNPWDLSRIPGGSSGGSAAVVAADEAIASLGSDTGGSIRQPAALCGCVGVKPSYGRVSRYGLTAFASSLEQIGPMTKTVEDAALLLRTIAGGDPADTTCLDKAVPDYLKYIGTDIKGLKVGLPTEYFIDGMDSGIRSTVEDAVKQLESLGAEVIEVSLPHTEYAVAVYYSIATAEASTNLSRFDGVRYGHRADAPKDLIDHYQRTRAEGFGPEVKRRIILGTYVLSSGYAGRYYQRAQQIRTLIREDFSKAFEKVDVIASPTSPVPAFKLGEKVDDPLQMYLADIYTIAANLAGICGITLPCGFSKDGDTALPVGLQLLGKSFDEQTLFRAAHAYEQSTDWHLKKPAC